MINSRRLISNGVSHKAVVKDKTAQPTDGQGRAVLIKMIDQTMTIIKKITSSQVVK